MDPIFKKRFGIRTKIHYLWDVKVPKALQKRFSEEWRTFYPRAKRLVSPSREKLLLRFMDKIYEELDDAFCTQKITIRFINKKVGYGVFAVEDISPYYTLGHYAGVLKLDKKVALDADSAFNFTRFRKYTIDASFEGNWTRFINHGEGKAINVIPWELYHPQGPRFVFTAGSKGIKKGEQLLYSYGDRYWDEESEPTLLSST